MKTVHKVLLAIPLGLAMITGLIFFAGGIYFLQWNEVSTTNGLLMIFGGLALVFGAWFIQRKIDPPPKDKI